MRYKNMNLLIHKLLSANLVLLHLVQSVAEVHMTQSVTLQAVNIQINTSCQHNSLQEPQMDI